MNSVGRRVGGRWGNGCRSGRDLGRGGIGAGLGGAVANSRRSRGGADRRCRGRGARRRGGARPWLFRHRGSRDCSGPIVTLAEDPGGRGAQHSDDEYRDGDRTGDTRPAWPTPVALPYLCRLPAHGDVYTGRGWADRQFLRRVVRRARMPAPISGLPPTRRGQAPMPAAAGIHPPVDLAHRGAAQLPAGY
jgi:hypothetical protein